MWSMREGHPDAGRQGEAKRHLLDLQRIGEDGEQKGRIKESTEERRRKTW